MATFQKRGKKWRAIVRRKGHVESRSFPTKAAAQEWARRIEHAADVGAVQEYQRPTTGQTVAWMIEEYTRAVSPVKPFGRSKAAVLNAMSRDLGDIPLKDLDATRLNRYVADRAAGGAGGVTIGTKPGDDAMAPGSDLVLASAADGGSIASTTMRFRSQT